jgi:hypothetical protein
VTQQWGPQSISFGLYLSGTKAHLQSTVRHPKPGHRDAQGTHYRWHESWSKGWLPQEASTSTVCLETPIDLPPARGSRKAAHVEGKESLSCERTPRDILPVGGRAPENCWGLGLQNATEPLNHWGSAVKLQHPLVALIGNYTFPKALATQLSKP